MNTAETPGTNNGKLNPNPEAGYALIILNNNYKYYLGGFTGFVSPLSGSPVTSVTSGNAYVIVSLGTTTLAQWQAAGVPAGFVPSIGLSFIATATGAIGGTGAVEVPSISGSVAVEVVGNPNQTINNSSIAANAGANLIVQFLIPGNMGIAAGAPADGSVCGMSIFMDISSVTIDGL